jgi:cytoskeletal protein CcmA (bactofilin family)
MFSKPASKSPAPRIEGPEALVRKPIACSLIAENVTLRGDVATDGDVHLDGALTGDMRVRELTIGEGGTVEGSIEAESVEIRGRVVGTVTAKSVRLYSTARVEGDITHAQLAIENGAHFEGRSLKFETPATVEPLAISAAE